MAAVVAATAAESVFSIIASVRVGAIEQKGAPWRRSKRGSAEGTARQVIARAATRERRVPTLLKVSCCGASIRDTATKGPGGSVTPAA